MLSRALQGRECDQSYVDLSHHVKPGVAAQTCNAGTQEVEAGGLVSLRLSLAIYSPVSEKEKKKLKPCHTK